MKVRDMRVRVRVKVRFEERGECERSWRCPRKLEPHTQDVGNKSWNEVIGTPFERFAKKLPRALAKRLLLAMARMCDHPSGISFNIKTPRAPAQETN